MKSNTPSFIENSLIQASFFQKIKSNLDHRILFITVNNINPNKRSADLIWSWIQAFTRTHPEISTTDIGLTLFADAPGTRYGGPISSANHFHGIIILPMEDIRIQDLLVDELPNYLEIRYEQANNDRRGLDVQVKKYDLQKNLATLVTYTAKGGFKNESRSTGNDDLGGIFIFPWDRKVEKHRESWVNKKKEELSEAIDSFRNPHTRPKYLSEEYQKAFPKEFFTGAGLAGSRHRSNRSDSAKYTKLQCFDCAPLAHGKRSTDTFERSHKRRKSKEWSVNSLYGSKFDRYGYKGVPGPRHSNPLTDDDIKNAKIAFSQKRNLLGLGDTCLHPFKAVIEAESLGFSFDELPSIAKGRTNFSEQDAKSFARLSRHNAFQPSHLSAWMELHKKAPELVMWCFERKKWPLPEGWALTDTAIAA